MDNQWYKLDNAAKFYPAFASKKDPATFRVAAVLHEPVNKGQLQIALDQTLPGFPSIGVTLKQGLFWYYLDKNSRRATVLEESKMPCTYINVKKSNGYLFQVYYYDKRISLECFHALTDGYGALEFLKALLYNYFRQTNSISSGDLRLVGDTLEDVEDAYKKYGRSEHTDMVTVPAQHVKGTPIHREGVLVTHACVDGNKLNQVAKSYGTTLTILLTAIYMKSLFKTIKKGPIVVAVPVNLRKMFPSKTLRNFSYVMNITMEKDDSIEGLIKLVSDQFKTQLDPSQLQGQISKNVDLEENLIMKLTPNVLKSMILKQARQFISKKVITSILTNPGIITLPNSIKSLVSHFECVLYASNPHRLNIGIVTYDNKMVISLSRNIKEDDVMTTFIEHLKYISKLDIDVTTNEGD